MADLQVRASFWCNMEYSGPSKITCNAFFQRYCQVHSRAVEGSISVIVAKLSISPIGSHVNQTGANFYCSLMVLVGDCVNLLIG
jgi:hypothetical protein